MTYSKNTKKVLNQIRKVKTLNDKEIMEIFKEGNYDINVTYGYGFGILYYLLQDKKYNLIMPVIQHKNFDININFYENATMLLEISQPDIFKNFLEVSLNTIGQKQFTQIAQFIEMGVSESIFQQNISTENVLIFFHVIENLISEEDINRLKDDLIIDNLSFSEIRNLIKLKANIENF